jgi:hypothetical protein
MREFFRGWRRKAGVVTLVMGLAVFAMWMRSMGCADFFRIASKDLILCLDSDRAEISIYVIHTQNEFKLWTWDREYLDADRTRATFARKWPEYHHAPDEWLILTTHWQLVLPLTLLSAYLILRKPRRTV